MIQAHLSVTIESRNQTDWIEDIARGLDLMSAYLRENRPEVNDSITNTLSYDASEVNFVLIHLKKIEI